MTDNYSVTSTEKTAVNVESPALELAGPPQSDRSRISENTNGPSVSSPTQHSAKVSSVHTDEAYQIQNNKRGPSQTVAAARAPEKKGLMARWLERMNAFFKRRSDTKPAEQQERISRFKSSLEESLLGFASQSLKDKGPNNDWRKNVTHYLNLLEAEGKAGELSNEDVLDIAERVAVRVAETVDPTFAIDRELAELFKQFNDTPLMPIFEIGVSARLQDIAIDRGNITGNPAHAARYHISQGNNGYGFTQTCVSCLTAQILNRKNLTADQLSGMRANGKRPITENDVVGIAKDIPHTANYFFNQQTGTVSPSGIATLLEKFGMKTSCLPVGELKFNSIRASEYIAKHVEEGRDVICTVSMERQLGDRPTSENGKCNHALLVTGVLRDETTNEVTGFFFNDPAPDIGGPSFLRTTDFCKGLFVRGSVIVAAEGGGTGSDVVGHQDD